MSRIEDIIKKVEECEGILISFDEDTEIELSAREIASALNEDGFHAFEIDRAPVTGKETLMHAFYQNLRFPGFFGFTWDSLKDILTGIDGVRDKGFVFVFSDLSQLSDEERSELIEVMEDANDVREHHDDLKKLRILTLK